MTVVEEIGCTAPVAETPFVEKPPLILAEPYPETRPKHEESMDWIMEHMAAGGYSGLIVPITRTDQSSNNLPFSLRELFLQNGEHAKYAVGCLRNVVDIHAQTQPPIFRKTLEWANHIGLRAMIMPPFFPEYVDSVARIVNQVLAICPGVELWVRIPLSPQKCLQPAWVQLRALCENNPRLFAVLECRTPMIPAPDGFLHWSAEPLKAVILEQDVWTWNRAGYPVLNQSYQRFVHAFMKMNVSFVISGSKGFRKEPTKDAYSRYLTHHLWETRPVKPTQFDLQAADYNDYLQAPLQPLMDNLDSTTYEVFMQDPVKYRLYEEGIYQRLLERKALDAKLGFVDAPDNQDAIPPSFQCLLMVVGAGSRGPLVSCAMRAAVRANMNHRVQIIAVEKNPNAFVTLQNQVTEQPQWVDYAQTYRGIGKAVEIVFSDMRSLETPSKKADFLVSELLGSFGDNEVSPECIDGAMHHLKSGSKEDDVHGRIGYSIPYSYTSYACPIASTALHRAVSLRSNSDGYPKAFETPYVTKFHRVFEIAESAKPVWTFSHGRTNKDDHQKRGNERSANISFTVKSGETTIHGFAGYFECTLFEPDGANGVLPVIMSTNPSTHSPEMFSWFPLYFPCREEVLVKSGDIVTFSIWRCVDPQKTKVWYEWSFKVAIAVKDGFRVTYQSPIHNPNGRSYWIGL